MKTGKKSGSGRLNRILYIFVTVSFVIPIVYLIVRLIIGGTGEDGAGYHSRADYILMMVQCMLGLFVIHVPMLLAKRFRFEVPPVLYSLYIVFLYCAVFLGEVSSFYYLVPHWDTFLHCFSSLMTGFFGFMVVTILNRDENLVIRLAPFFVALFAFSFAVTIGTVWEVYEFAVDSALGLNMQKYLTVDGIFQTGREALMDTMKDIVIDVIGAFASSVVGYISLKAEKRWLVPVLTHEEKRETAAEGEVTAA